MSTNYDLRRSMAATYEEAERRPQPRRGPARHAFKEEVTERPAWVYPVLIAAAVVTASAIALFMLVGPKDLSGNTPVGTSSSTPINMVIGNIPLKIPENFTQFPRARHDGTLNGVSLYAALPKFTPYTDAKKNVFFDNAPNSPIVFFKLSAIAPPLTEAERLDAVFMPHVAKGGGAQGPGGLTRYQFKEGTPFSDEDLFVGKEGNGETVIIRCSLRSGTVPSPNCWRETMLANGLAMTYRFKRPYLKYWQGIDRGLRALVERFRTAAARGASSSAP